MTINTKFNIGDKVWLIDRGHAVQKTITAVRIGIHEDGTYIRYVFTSRDDSQVEEKVFATKQELIESL